MRAIADRIEPPRYEEQRRRVYHAPAETLFKRDPGIEATRAEHAFSMLDEDTLGYVLVRARRVGDDGAELVVGIALEDELWTPMRETLSRVVVESARVESER